MAGAISSFVDIGAEPGDSRELHLEKRMLVTVSGLGLIVGIGWGVVYVLLGELGPALIPGCYGILTAINLLVFARTKRYRLFQNTQLIFYLFLPFFLQYSLGGFVGGSAVAVFALFAPFGALVMKGRQSGTRWLLAYASLMVISLLLRPDMTIENNLTNAVVGWLFVGNIVGISIFMFVTMNFFVGQRDIIQDALEQEQEKSEHLLLNILPAQVAADLKEEGRTEARAFEEATVLFADQVGFTNFAAGASPDHLVATLNEIFTGFDEIAAKHGVEKIRTIGDAFMAATGVPVPCDDHATTMADAALDMIEFLKTCDGVDFRLGIHTGPLVAGVVGTSKFQYDIWGDTVNVASRMESTSLPGRIQVTESTHRHLEDDFILEERGIIDVKGKGLTKTWYLVSRKD